MRAEIVPQGCEVPINAMCVFPYGLLPSQPGRARRGAFRTARSRPSRENVTERTSVPNLYYQSKLSDHYPVHAVLT